MTESQQIKIVIKELLKIAPEILKKLQYGYRELSNRIVSQDSQDITTNLDHEIGKYVYEDIKKVYPNIAIESEEKEETTGFDSLVIRLDPIDGTKHFAAGIPLFSSNIILKNHDKTVFAMIVDMGGSDIYHAIKGAAYKNNRKIIVNELSIKNSFVFVEDPSSKLYQKNSTQYEINWDIASKIQKIAFRTRKIGVGGLSIVHVASGAASAYVDLSGTTKLVDVEAGVFIAIQAGAQVVDDKGFTIGENISFDQNTEKKELSTNIMVGNPLALKELSALI